MDQESTNLPAQIADALVSIPKGLTPGVIKALDRLVGASVDIPIAWLQQKKAKIDAQTESYKLVEASIAETVASGAGADPDIAQRAMNKLVRKEYRKQVNREAVASAMVEDLRDQASSEENLATGSVPASEVDDDWLNVFERYAEDASSERLQGLWGKVLAGEVRQPGRFSTRTLRFLSEFSQADALLFETFAKSAFGDSAPKKLVAPEDQEDISDRIYLEASGLIQGASGLGLEKTLMFNEHGRLFVREGNLVVLLTGEPEKKVQYKAIVLTQLGQEVLCLVGSRNAR
ncbi:MULTISPECIES: DUF2806 domain-containing protein [Phaeobacter]|uniref:DUF2806 domain-containing protein n=1 Tax=Phaeobacter TaxID=302485 RepID=UPI000C9A154B|nr:MULTISPECIES: DUF2806 domain-containing protein [Phaeobacter]AUQ56361.1 hypothetical protein PhaeoP92_03743 [Phaeobacter inhibens]AUQ80377.1 hypothetical protein PhaeoP74_03744 [Phaeobacter inhibens]AUR17536.1 hypothetical protein PhaeoP70_03742 [Phaeobacter inhibens]AUR37784.1 hypothetical protein PhaeoP18_03566 [Phaeobacter piscinae]